MEVAPNRKIRVGEVVSNKMQNGVVVKIERKILHTAFKKYVKRTKKYVAHDEGNSCRIGDTVKIVETRPLSKTKRWRVISVLSSKEGSDDTAANDS
ncbi:MAG: hypothetical protein IEMM0002_0040 [bacterium]|nr:MAG: hypothetical protein IEMM0002_0040 [bacterium]